MQDDGKTPKPINDIVKIVMDQTGTTKTYWNWSNSSNTS